MEKLTGPKHNHLLTDLLKIAIFGLMLLLPFLCFLPTGFYYGFNEHATNETTTQINYKYQSNEVNSREDIVRGNIYFTERLSIGDDCAKFSLVLLQYESASLTVGSFEDYATSEFTNNESALWVKFDSSVRPYGIRYYFTNLNTYVKTIDDQDVYADFNNVIFYIPLNTDDTTFNLTLSLFNDSYGFGNTMPQYTDYNVIDSVETNVQDTISNKMYQAWQGVWTSPLFNWTNTTPLNNGLNGFVSIFGINQSSYIANCLIYLLSITAIYVVFDIVLSFFKWLTHLIGNK